MCPGCLTFFITAICRFTRLNCPAGKLKDHEVKRAIELRNIVTSLGPAYIKLGQALSIRPDILSPAAMNELQKLCDKVPSFDSAVAMQVQQLVVCLGYAWVLVAASQHCWSCSGSSTAAECLLFAVRKAHVLDVLTQQAYLHMPP